jgi:hypothetical protein
MFADAPVDLLGVFESRDRSGDDAKTKLIAMTPG